MIKKFRPGKKKCANCGTPFEKEINLPFKNWCSVDCAYKISQKLKAKKANKEWQAEKKVMKENIMKYGDWLKRLEDAINPIARYIDYGQPCISCKNFGKPQAGHYHTVNSDGTIRFNLHNIHIQDYHCNVERSANIIGYDEGLIRIYGRDYWEYVKFQLKNIYHLPLKLSIPEIKEAIEISKEILKELKAAEVEYSPIQRLQLRDRLNKRIGIYKHFYSEYSLTRGHK